ncbi:MAG: NAD(P)/FAD-dependent oxidoreductase, partial [Vicinamibacterales bacterium]|nr:NAD(P)/FAD-dependent oxidoreductase [Vicinamibacterales bacterium]
LTAAASRPTATLGRELGALLPASVADVLIRQAGVDPATPLAHLAKDARRAVIRAALTLPLRVTGSRGYQYAEATAGGVPLEEIDPATMESRVCPGLYLAGEILDVDGRLGGFNFQWAWSSGWVAGTAVARRADGGTGRVPVSG